MGTSLSGLTPATTFDGLLKVGDNDPLTADLKAISTGDGTDTILSLSDSALQVNGQATIAGAGNDNTTTALLVQNSDGVQLLKMVNDGSSILGNSTHYVNVESNGYVNIVSNRVYSTGSRFYYNDGNGYIARLDAAGFQVGNGASDPAATIHAKGSGATSATTSLLVQNSAGTELLKVQDDGDIYSQYLRINGQSASPLISTEGNAGKAVRLGNEGYFSSFNYLDLKTWDGTSYSPAMRITGNTDQRVGIGETTPTARLHVKGSGNDATTAALLVQNSDGTDALKVTDDAKVSIDAIKLSNIKAVNSDLRFDIGGTGTIKVVSDKVAIGGNTTPTARMHIKGSGNDATTTALLVQNSDGTDMLKVTDDGQISASGDRLTIGDGANVTLRILASGNAAAGNNYIQPLGTPANQRVIVTGNSVATIKAVDLDASNVYIGHGINQTAATGTLSIKGSGTTSATTALLVQNSAGTDLLKLEDGGLINIGGSNGYTIQSNLISPKINGYIALDRNSNRTFNIGDNAASRIYLKVQSSLTSNFADVSINTDHLVVKKEGAVGIGETTPTARLHVKAGTTLDTIARFQDPESATSYLDIKQESGTFSTYTSLFYGTDPKIRSKQGGRLYLESSNEIRFTTGVVVNTIFDETGSVAHGSNSLPANTRAYIKGSGATSATTALLVQNSAGADLLKVVNDGTLRLAGNKSVRFFGNESIEGSNQGGNHIRIAESSFWGSTRINAPTNITEANAAPDASAILQADSTTQGFLPPRMTDAERDAITNPAAGLMIYDTSNNQMNYWNGSTWIAF